MNSVLIIPNSGLDWPQTPAEALACQERLRSQVRLQPLPAPPRLVAGVDAAYSKTEADNFWGRGCHVAAGTVP